MKRIALVVLIFSVSLSAVFAQKKSKKKSPESAKIEAPVYELRPLTYEAFDVMSEEVSKAAQFYLGQPVELIKNNQVQEVVADAEGNVTFLDKTIYLPDTLQGKYVGIRDGFIMIRFTYRDTVIATKTSSLENVDLPFVTEGEGPINAFVLKPKEAFSKGMIVTASGSQKRLPEFVNGSDKFGISAGEGAPLNIRMRNAQTKAVGVNNSVKNNLTK